jgi:TonB family protein
VSAGPNELDRGLFVATWDPESSGLRTADGGPIAAVAAFPTKAPRWSLVKDERGVDRGLAAYRASGGGLEPKVELDCRLTEAGMFDHCKVAKSGGRDFDSAVQDAVKEWRYTPSLVDGKPRTLGYHIAMQFTVEYRR